MIDKKQRLCLFAVRWRQISIYGVSNVTDKREIRAGCKRKFFCVNKKAVCSESEQRERSMSANLYHLHTDKAFMLPRRIVYSSSKGSGYLPLFYAASYLP